MRITVEEAVKKLNEGRIVVFPTETVYGLGAIATNAEAVKKVFIAKQRPTDNPLICHFYSIEQIETYVSHIPLAARILYQHFSPGPLSILLDLPLDSLLKTATCGQPRVVCRIPNHPAALELLKKTTLPIAAPSANTSGRMSGTDVEMIERDIGHTVDGIVDGGPCSVGLESTIIDGRNEKKISILRPGSVGDEEIRNVLDKAYAAGLLLHRVQVNKNEAAHVVVPGAKYRHYAPITPVYAVPSLNGVKEEDEVVVIATEERFISQGIMGGGSFKKDGNVYLCIGSIKNLEEVARNLYKTFYRVDKIKAKKAYFITEEWGSSSMAQALQNRLSKVLIHNS